MRLQIASKKEEFVPPGAPAAPTPDTRAKANPEQNEAAILLFIFLGGGEQGGMSQECVTRGITTHGQVKCQ